MLDQEWDFSASLYLTPKHINFVSPIRLLPSLRHPQNLHHPDEDVNEVQL